MYQDLYIWRERRAQKYNQSKKQILKDESLLDITKAHPKTVDELKNLKIKVLSSKAINELVDLPYDLTIGVSKEKSTKITDFIS